MYKIALNPKLSLDRMSHSKTLSPKIHKISAYIKEHRHDAEILNQLFTFHEFYIKTLEMCEVLLFIQKKYTLNLDKPFTRVLREASTINITKPQMRHIYKRINDDVDRECFHTTWNIRQLGLRERYRNSRESWFTRSHSTFKTRMNSNLLHFSLRLSMKSVITAMEDLPSNLSVLTTNNVGYSRISSVLTYIDKALFEKLQVSDLKRLNKSDASKTVKKITEQQKGVMQKLILATQNSEEITEALELLLRVCKHLRRQRNFHSLLTVLLVIEEFPENRKELSLNKKLYFDRLMSIYDPSGAYRNYRMYFGPEKESALGCFPVFSRDMFLLFEHNTFWVDGRINEVFLKSAYDQYSALKRGSKIQIVGRVDPRILKELLFVEL